MHLSVWPSAASKVQPPPRLQLSSNEYMRERTQVKVYDTKLIYTLKVYAANHGRTWPLTERKAERGHFLSPCMQAEWSQYSSPGTRLQTGSSMKTMVTALHSTLKSDAGVYDAPLFKRESILYAFGGSKTSMRYMYIYSCCVRCQLAGARCEQEWWQGGVCKLKLHVVAFLDMNCLTCVPKAAFVACNMNQLQVHFTRSEESWGSYMGCECVPEHQLTTAVNKNGAGVQVTAMRVAVKKVFGQQTFPGSATTQAAVDSTNPICQ